MTRPHPLRTTLACLLALPGVLQAGAALKPMSAEGLSFIKAGRQGRSEILRKQVLELRPSLGLNADHGFALQSSQVDEFGKTHARFQQMYRGLPVWNGRGIGHMEPDGTLRPLQTAFQDVQDLDTHPAIDAERILEFASRHLPAGLIPLHPFKSELLVLPASEVDGIKFKRTAAGGLELDPEFTVALGPVSRKVLLAYRVCTIFTQPGKGLRSIDLMLDANTGALLKKSDGARYDQAALGTGHTQYRGDQSLSTTYLDATNVFQLRDGTRPKQPHTLSAASFPEAGNRTAWFQGEDIGGGWTSYQFPQCMKTYENTTNTWGDGRPFTFGAPLATTNGETVAADIHYGVQTTWDMLQHVFQREGLDGQSGSIFTVAHSPIATNNAVWFSDQMAHFGDMRGIPESLVCLEIVAHELGHGFMGFTADLNYADESGGLNESNSDILGALATFYASRDPLGDPTVLPDVGGEWRNGAQIFNPPLRYLYRPSLDGSSYDSWFHGVGVEDVHYTSGIGNRFFYFLSCGTNPSDPDRQSIYLPGGMTGIGNQKAARIWYRAISHYVADAHTDYAGMREATLLAADELFPPSAGGLSPEGAALRNAWAAVNIGGAAGQPTPVRVRLILPRPTTGSQAASTLLLPMGESFRLATQVQNASNTNVTYSLGGLSLRYASGGTVTPEGVFTSPLWPGLYPLKTTSVQDSRQYAVATIQTVNLDLEKDGDQDGCDLGLLALNFGKSAPRSWSVFPPIPSPLDLAPDEFVDDSDVAVFLATFHNAYGQ